MFENTHAENLDKNFTGFCISNKNEVCEILGHVKSFMGNATEDIANRLNKEYLIEWMNANKETHLLWNTTNFEII